MIKQHMIRLHAFKPQIKVSCFWKDGQFCCWKGGSRGSPNSISKSGQVREVRSFLATVHDPSPAVLICLLIPPWVCPLLMSPVVDKIYSTNSKKATRGTSACPLRAELCHLMLEGRNDPERGRGSWQRVTRSVCSVSWCTERLNNETSITEKDQI